MLIFYKYTTKVVIRYYNCKLFINFLYNNNILGRSEDTPDYLI